MRYKRWVACMLAIAVCLAGIPAMAKEEYITIAELYTQTRDGWHAEYIAPEHKKYGGIPEDYRFTINVDIQVPDVQAFPVLDLMINKNIFEDDTVVHLIQGQVRLDGALESQTMFDYQTGEGIWFSHSLYPVVPDGQAENNPLSPDDAEAVFRNCINKYFGVDNIDVSAVVGFGGTPQFTQEQLDTGKDKRYLVMAQGVYMLEGRQVFEGIPLLATGTSWKRHFPYVFLQMTLLNESCYKLTGTTLNQSAILYEDVPLLPWQEIQKAFETQCIGGNRMYDVYSVELGYQLTIIREGENTAVASRDGDRKTYPEGTFDEIYTARPVWVIRGKVPLETAGFMLEEQIEFQKNEFTTDSALSSLHPEFNADAMILNAQTGALINFTSDKNQLDVVFPKILQWSDAHQE